MDRIEKLLELARLNTADGGVHIIADEYCNSCRGRCRALEMEGSSIIFKDVPMDAGPTGSAMQEIADYNDMPGYSSLTWEEKAMLLKKEYGIDVEISTLQRQRQDAGPGQDPPELSYGNPGYAGLFDYG